MAISIKRVFSNSILVLGCIYSAVYLLGCLTPYISPASFYPLTFLALLFPYLLLGMIVWLVIVLIFYRKKTWIFLLLLAMGFQNIASVFAFRTGKQFVRQKDAKTIRVLSWNVQDFLDSQYHTDTVGNKRRDMMAFIHDIDADIVCIQDFTEQTNPAYRSCINDVIAAGNFKYHFFSKDFAQQYYYAFSEYGTAIFSRFPIIDSGRIVYPGNRFPESLAYADIKMGNDTVRVHNTHLRSMYLKFVADTANKDEFIKDELNFLAEHPQLHDRLRHYDLQHIAQVHIAKPFMDACKHPYIFCGDLNSVPSSYVYHHLSKGLKDAFVAKGSGIGGTYDGIAPTLRIDVILMSKQFKPVQYYSPRFHASDHFPVVTDMQLH